MKARITKAVTAVFVGCMLVFACLGLVACGGGSSSGSASGSASASAASVDTSKGYKLVNAGKLTIGSDLDYKPMEYLEGSTPAGFDVEMMQEVCKRLGVETNYLSPQNFDSLITQVAGGSSMDVAVSSITINDERSELIDFSAPYFDSNQAVVTLADAPYTTKEQLNGKPVGAQSGTTGEEWVKENLKDSQYTPYTMPTDALAALRAGKIEAVIYDSSVALNQISQDAGTYKLVEEIATGEQYGIAVNKNNPELLKAINNALSEMQKDGTMDKLKKKWFG